MELLKISAKNLGVTALEDFCPRCYWIKLKMGNRLPFQTFPGIFSSIDSYTKACVHYIIDSHKENPYDNPLPCWMKSIGDIVDYEPIPHWSKSKFVDEKTGITLSGIPDDLFVRSDGSKALVDWKTAKKTNTQDVLLPMYEIQLVGYSVLICKDADLYLIYMEPLTEKSSVCNNITDCGFQMKFNAVVVPIENNKKLLRAALNLTRDIYQLNAPPSGRVGCKDCEALDQVMGAIGMGKISNAGTEE